MKIQPYIMAVAILLLTFSSAANKAIADLGQVEIDDLFYNSGAPSINGEIKKFEFDQVDKILIKNEDLELESLEIADIDLATFGEYENFLNKYYDDNYTQINSKFIKQLEFNASTSLGSRIPFGANAKRAFTTGSDFGLSISPASTFKILNFDSNPFLNINYTVLYPKESASDTYAPFKLQNYKILRITSGITNYLSDRIFTKIGVSLISTSSEISSETIEGGKQAEDYGASINVDLGYKFNVIKDFNIGFYFRAQTMLLGTTDPPIDGGGTLETLSVGILFDSPIYLVY